MKLLLTFFVSLSMGCFINAQETPDKPSLVFIYDASGSMWGKMESRTKKEIASDVLTQTVQSLDDKQKIGLVAYGHRNKKDCRDVETLVDFSSLDKAMVVNAVKEINPLGKTPLAYSASTVIDKINSSGIRATVILITDGIESCDGDLCKVITDAKKRGVAFKLHIVGFGLKDSETEALRCAARAGEGNYFDAGDSQALSDVFAEATNKTVDDPLDNVSVFASMNGDAIDCYVKVYASDGKGVNAGRTYRDTARIYLPPGEYTLEANALEGTKLPAVKQKLVIEDGGNVHRDVSFDSGTAQINVTNNGEPWDAVVKFLDPDSGKAIANARTYARSKDVEILPGIYDVSYQALNLEGTDTYVVEKGVVIKGNQVNKISKDFESGIAMIGVQTTSGELVDATVNFVDQANNKRVAGSRTYTSPRNNPREFTLTPGVYLVKIVTLGVHKGSQDSFEIEVKKGETVERIVKI